LAEGSREPLAEEVAAVGASEKRSSLGDDGFSPLAPLTADSLLLLQRRAGNRAAAAHVARQAAGRRLLQRSGGLLKPQKVQDVYGYWLLELARARGVNVDNSIDAAARAKVKTQVGDLNFAQWERWERGIDEKAAEAGERAAAPALDPEAQMRARHDQMWKETAAMRAEVVQTEYLAQKLNFGTGAKGTAARLTAGGYTAMWGIGARTVSSVAEHVPLLVVSSVGLVLGSELAERTLIKQGRAIAQEGGEMGEDVLTAKLLVGGEMQAAYNATRGPYTKYQAAFTAFSEAGSKFLKDQALDGINGYSARASDIGAMDSAEKQMREAAADYQIACAKLGVQSNAKRLDTLGAHIVQGLHEAVATAVTVGLPEVAPGLGELRGAFKGGEGMSAKQIEKEAADAVAKSLVKEGEGAALKVGLEAEARTGMPVKNQQAIADACKAHDVVIEVRGTNPEAPRRLAGGDLPKPEAIKAKSINQLDTYLGFRKEDVGLVGYMEPKPPVQSEVPPELWGQVQKRYAERVSEFKDLAPEMKNLARPVGARDQFAAVGFDKQLTVDANGVIRVVEGSEGKAAAGFTGDHDIFQITNADGSAVSPQKYNEVVTDLVQQQVGVEHGAHMAWDVPAKPASPAYKDPTKGFQGIAGKHMPGATGGEDLYRFAPDGSITPVRADPAAHTLDAARGAGRASKGAAVPDIDRTIQGSARSSAERAVLTAGCVAVSPPN
jgi:hypothetical protein